MVCNGFMHGLPKKHTRRAPEALWGGPGGGHWPPRRGRAGNRCEPLQTSWSAAKHALLSNRRWPR
eukprot:14919800-Alexandrium_andersonii.AAC.1